MKSKEKLHILVIEDNPIHIEAAREQLGANPDYDLTIETTYKQGAIQIKLDRTNAQGLVVPKFDVVLTDCFMPAEKEGMNEPDSITGELPYGLLLKDIAIIKGIPMVAMVTRGGHHQHPLLWAMDASANFYDRECLMMGNTTYVCGDFYLEGGDIPYADWKKDWQGALLTVLIGVRDLQGETCYISGEEAYKYFRHPERIDIPKHTQIIEAIQQGLPVTLSFRETYQRFYQDKIELAESLQSSEEWEEKWKRRISCESINPASNDNIAIIDGSYIDESGETRKVQIAMYPEESGRYGKVRYCIKYIK